MFVYLRPLPARVDAGNCTVLACVESTAWGLPQCLVCRAAVRVLLWLLLVLRMRAVSVWVYPQLSCPIVLTNQTQKRFRRTLIYYDTHTHTHTEFSA